MSNPAADVNNTPETNQPLCDASLPNSRVSGPCLRAFEFVSLLIELLQLYLSLKLLFSLHYFSLHHFMVFISQLDTSTFVFLAVSPVA